MAQSRVNKILATVMSHHAGTATLPELLCQACADALPVSGVGMGLMTDAGHEGAIAATDGPARLMEDLQFTLGEGPCLDASREGRPVLHPDLARTALTRWPVFGPAVLEAGIAAIFAFPLQVGWIRLGVLDIYRDRAGNLDNEELAQALAFADAAVVILVHLQSQVGGGEGMHPQLTETSGNRPEIHQATGMVSVQAIVGLTEAFLLLRAHSFSSERSILDVARDVVARRLRFPAEGRRHG